MQGSILEPTLLQFLVDLEKIHQDCQNQGCTKITMLSVITTVFCLRIFTLITVISPCCNSQNSNGNILLLRSIKLQCLGLTCKHTMKIRIKIVLGNASNKAMTKCTESPANILSICSYYFHLLRASSLNTDRMRS